MFEPVRDLFTTEFAVPSESRADEIIYEQRQFWANLLMRIGSVLQNRDQQSFSAVNHLGSHIAGIPDLFRRPHDVEKGFVVTGRVPLLTRSGTTIDSFATEHPYEMLGAILAESGDNLLNILRDSGYPQDRLNWLFGAQAQAAATHYLLEKQEAKIAVQIRTAVEEALHKNTSLIQENVEASNTALGDLRGEIATQTLDLTELGLGMRRTLERVERQEAARVEAEQARIEAATKDWSTLIEQSRRDIDAAKALAFEAATFRSARQIWQWKKTKHSVTFGLGLLMLALLIGSAITALILNWQTVIAAMPRNTQGEPLTGFLIFIVVPLIAAAWVLRIFARYITNALTLGEDAEQRRAMLETYFSLVGNKDAKMEPSDRILVLNAIFRPLPGHQSEDVAPPTLLDLTKEALSKKGG